LVDFNIFTHGFTVGYFRPPRCGSKKDGISDNKKAARKSDGLFNLATRNQDAFFGAGFLALARAVLRLM